MDSTTIAESFDTFKSVTKQPELFLKSQHEKAEKIKSSLLEAIYRFSKYTDKKKKAKALPKLITNGMDDESIWQQLEISNEENIHSHIKNVSQFLASSTEKFKLNLSDLQGSDVEEEEETGEVSTDHDSEEEVNERDLNQQEDDEENDDDSQDGDSDSNENLQPKHQKSKKSFGAKSIVDDQFFKLSEMEEFLQREEQEKKDDTFEVDLFTSDDTNREESLKYSDFYEDGNEEDEYEEEDEEPEEKAEGPKSSYELMQERLQKKIAHMENTMIDDRPWQMKGEVKADNRPQNSLLEEFLEFDSTTRPAPIITEEVTLKLEDIIKQRIKDKAFDDVERKVKPSDIRTEYKKQLVLDQEKSKQSLAQIYEKEFINKIDKINGNDDVEEEQEPKEHKDIRAEIKDLFDKLDLLSNFYYTPRPAQPELKIITNLPTIAMEEVAPVAVSDAAMLAPEEIKRKSKGEVFGESERTKTDKNRERRHKKVFQREKQQKKPIGGKSLLEKVSKGRNVEMMKTGDKSKSSSEFFNKLQESITVGDNGKTSKKRKREKQNHQAKKLKL